MEPLAASVGSDLLLDVDVCNDASLDAAFAELKDRWGSMDFLVHAIAFSDKAELTGRFRDTSRANFAHSLDISCYSFIDAGRRAAALMPDGGCLLTVTFQGSNKVTPFYNVMGVAKAALESATRYLANDLGPDGIRVNAISPGPMKNAGRRSDWRGPQDLPPHRSQRPLAHERHAEQRGRRGGVSGQRLWRAYHGRDRACRWRLSHHGFAAGREPIKKGLRPLWAHTHSLGPGMSRKLKPLANRQAQRDPAQRQGQRCRNVARGGYELTRL